MRLKHLLVLIVCQCLVVCPLAWGQAQRGGGLGEAGGLASGSAAVPADNQVQGEYEIIRADGSGPSGYYVARHTYVLAPGWAKSRRILGMSSQMGGGHSYLSTRSGQGKQRGAVNAGGMSAQTLPEGGIVMTAIVLAKGEGDKHAQVLVGQVPTASGGMGGMPGGMGMGMDMAGGGDMMGGGMPGMGGGYDGGMGAMGGMMGGEGGMMGGGMVKVLLRPLQECRITALGKAGGEAKLTVAQLKNLEELVRVDCWIEEELSTLRAVRGEADKFKAAEDGLKELLSQEYELQLSKQRDDIDRLNEKLKALQSELARRASAQDRVVDVQLGQLILEAQGLIGERP